MPTTIDFDKIFSTNASSTPFTWSDSDYLVGWDSIENTPPSRQQFNALHMISDLKDQELNNVKAPKHSPVFTGDPQAPTPAKNDNDNSLATTSFVQSWVSELQQAIDDIGVGITDIGKWYYCWDDDFIFQYGDGVTDANGICTLTFPIAFPTFPNGEGCYIPLICSRSSYSSTATFGTNFGLPYRTAQSLTFRVQDGTDGSPAANVYVAVAAFGMQAEPV